MIDPGQDGADEDGQLLNEVEYREAQEQCDEEFVAGMGYRSGEELCRRSTSTKLNKELEEAMKNTKSKQIRKKLAKRS